MLARIILNIIHQLTSCHIYPKLGCAPCRAFLLNCFMGKYVKLYGHAMLVALCFIR
jgi:hypothetical protein